jgi:hypothetical protein
MATYNKFNQTVLDFVNGIHDFDAHTFKVALSNTAPVATNTVLANITQLANGNGYTTGGTATAITTSLSTATAKVVGADVTFTATGALGPMRYAVFYNDTPTSPADPLIAWWDYGSSVTLAATETFTVDFDGTNGIFQLT